MADTARSGKMEYFKASSPLSMRARTARIRWRFATTTRPAKSLARTMEEHLRLAVCYWHSFCWDGTDIFGQGTFHRPWLKTAMTPEAARYRWTWRSSFLASWGLPFYCFHDADVMAEPHDVKEYVAHFGAAVDGLERNQAETGTKLLWGTANLFSHPRYAAGAATNPDPEIFAFAAMQVRHCMDATKRLGGSNYVLWGGREGYDTLLNTDLKKEVDQFGHFLQMVVEHKHKIGFKGTILIEPKPFEPNEAPIRPRCRGGARLLAQVRPRQRGEGQHRSQPRDSFGPQLRARNRPRSRPRHSRSIDMNRGDPQNGWDTDQFPNDPLEMTLAMYRVLKAGGLGSGGFNFDAKVRRQSIDPADMFHGHVGATDLLARALLAAAAIIEDGKLDQFVKERYSRWSGSWGEKAAAKDASLASLSDAVVAANNWPAQVSGRQEYLENLINRFV